MKTFYFYVQNYMWCSGTVCAFSKEIAFGIAYVQVHKLVGFCTLTIDDIYELKENEFFIKKHFI